VRVHAHVVRVSLYSHFAPRAGARAAHSLSPRAARRVAACLISCAARFARHVVRRPLRALLAPDSLPVARLAAPRHHREQEMVL
jgi:hypothetical protein